MSIKVSKVAQYKIIGSQTRKAVLMYLCAVASNDGTGIWVSKGNMALDLEMSKRTVQKAIAELVQTGVVSEDGERKCRYGYSVNYRINLTVLESRPDTRKRFTPTGAGDSPVPVNEVHPNSTGNRPLNTLLRKEPDLDVVQYAREEIIDDHLADDPKYDAWLAAEKSRHG